jgi:DNA segregation ATPase FtsK/SpoIIIE-like protein
MSWLPELSERRQRQVLGVLLVAFAGLAAASLATYRSPIAGARPWAEANACGPLGAWMAHGLVRWLGNLAAWGVPALALAFGWNRLAGAPAKPLIIRGAVLSALVLEVLALVGLVGPASAPWAGTAGLGSAEAMASMAGTVGGGILLVALFLITLLVASQLGFTFLAVAFAHLRGWVAELWSRWRAGAERPAAGPTRAKSALAVAKPARPAAGERGAERAPAPVDPRINEPSAAVASAAESARDRRVLVRGGGSAGARDDAASRPGRPAAAVEAERREGAGVPVGAVPVGSAASGPLSVGATAIAPAHAPDATAGAGAASALGSPLTSVPYAGAFPPLEMLEVPRETVIRVDHDELKAEAQLLATKLADFGIRGTVTEVNPGPVITTFEFEPAPGIKVSQITSREDDLALALRASRIRILAPIPGKGAVGIEIPNRSPRKVYLREVLSSEGYVRQTGALKFALGVDVNGRPVGADLTRMPHVLVAGATGSGKSVYLNVLIASLLFNKGPDALRFLMIDPKMIELTGYNGIPHLLMPVVTDAKRAAKALRWAVAEMERRYRVLAACGARNIEGLNEKIGGARPPTGPQGEPLAKLPYIVILVDELADLMLTMPVEMEEPIGRLAQMARAVGVHLVLATQRPSVDVLTGVIKANFPSRIAFQVSSKTDSRTILDMNGAECLLGMGDMLYLPAGRAEPLRVHAPFVSDGEMGKVADFWRENAPSSSVAGAGLEEAIERAQEGDDEDDDELVGEAVRLVVLHQQGSTSLLQRRLKVGYSRASRLMDRLESLGVVGPFMGSKARDVLVDESYLEEHNLR